MRRRNATRWSSFSAIEQSGVTVTKDGPDQAFRRSFDEVSGLYLAALRDGSDGTPMADIVAQIDDDPLGGAVIYRDAKTAHVCELARRVARRPTTVLLRGESGVGKEVFARFIHRKSKRAEGPMVAINCAAISPGLLESELFGHEKGAFSGAVNRRIGVFEQAHGGTLLLDEISEMPLELQAKLLRAIQERQILRVGGSESIDVDIRIIATTNRDLEQTVADGQFRQDLFFRLNVFPLEIPALRHRRDDIEPLAKYYAQRLARLFEQPVKEFEAPAMARLRAYDFPGNIRELINIVERALILAEEAPVIEASHLVLQEGALAAALPTESETREATDSETESLAEDTQVDEDPHQVGFRAGDMPLTDVRRVVIERTLARNEGNRAETARQLGVSPRTIRNKLKDYESRED